MNDSCVAVLGSLPPGGDYFSLFKIILMLALLLPWLYACTWVNKDVVYVKTYQLPWKLAVLGGGALGVLIWLALPWFAAGLAAYLVLAGGAFTGYVLDRNKRVVPPARVFTRAHLKRVISRAKPRKIEVVQRIKLYDNLGRPVFAPPEDEPEKRQAYNLAQNFLHNVVLFHASQAEMTPSGNQTQIKLQIDGVTHDRPAIALADSEQVVDFVKGLAAMKVDDRRRPQKGKMGLELGAVHVDVTVSTAGTTGGQQMSLLIAQESARTNLDELGMPEEMRLKLERYNAAPGLIIISGQRNQGVTSTMYSLLRKHDAFTRQLATLESKITVEMENVTQNTYADITEMAGKLAGLLRRDPDVVMVENCETAQAAGLIIDAASQKNVLLGLSADSAFVALAKWVKAANVRDKALAPLRAVTCQVLLRKLCPQCREAYVPPKDMVAKLNLPADKIENFYRTPTKPRLDDKGKPLVDAQGRPIPCPTCRGTGYYGRTAAFELLEVTGEIRELVAADASLKDIKVASRKNKMRYLQEQALIKVIEGVTSIEEVIRVSKSKSNP